MCAAGREPQSSQTFLLVAVGTTTSWLFRKTTFWSFPQVVTDAGTSSVYGTLPCSQSQPEFDATPITANRQSRATFVALRVCSGRAPRDIGASLVLRWGLPGPCQPRPGHTILFPAAHLSRPAALSAIRRVSPSRRFRSRTDPRESAKMVRQNYCTPRESARCPWPRATPPLFGRGRGVDFFQFASSVLRVAHTPAHPGCEP